MKYYTNDVSRDVMDFPGSKSAICHYLRAIEIGRKRQIWETCFSRHHIIFISSNPYSWFVPSGAGNVFFFKEGILMTGTELGPLDGSEKLNMAMGSFLG